jgi:eukaryotic-like serine/threonine-protein kinase
MSASRLTLTSRRRLAPPDPLATTADDELRAHVQRALAAHYELDCEIGRGGMGIVYRARDRRLKRQVAIKLLPPELAFRSEIKSRFLREAETAAQLSHPSIVPIYTVDEQEQLVFFVMAYVSGDNLAKRLHERGVLTVEETRKILRDVGDALAYAHERGVVHRDIKPDNILIDQGSGRPMVTDFGIARAITDGDSRLTATGIAIGTPTYMSPEQAAGDREIDGRSDLYALGVVAYQMLTGQPPFTASSTPAILVKHLSERPIPVEQRRADVPRDLSRIVMTLLEKDPAARFPTAGAMVAALDGGQMSGPADAPAAEAARRSSFGYIAPMSPPAAVSPMASAPATPPRAFGMEIGLDAGSFGDRGSFTGNLQVPVSLEEQRRWDAQPVRDFRRILAPYLYVNAVIVIADMFTTHNFTSFTVIWTIYMAYKYAKLWSNGYDWHDIFRQPREREIVDVVEDSVGYMKAMFNREERTRLRTERHSRAMAARTSGGMQMPVGAGQPQPRTALPAGADSATIEQIRRAEINRDEILQMISEMKPADRAQVPDVGRSASALADRVRSLAISLSDIERNGGNQSVASLESEISKLEGDANPLDLAGSETRVKRLAFLKRQRRGLADVVQRRKQIAGKLETCVSALEIMRSDLNRLKIGNQSPQNITALAMQALSLADSVDHALAAADEVGRLTSDRPLPRPTS